MAGRAFKEDRFDAVLAQIVLHPDNWNQSTWGTRTECGTSHCFAGWTLHAENFIKPDRVVMRWTGDEVGDFLSRIEINTSTGREYAQRPEVAARLALGITSDEADLLFYRTGTSFAALEASVNVVRGNHGLPPRRMMDFIYDTLSPFFPHPDELVTAPDDLSALSETPARQEAL